MPPAASFKKLGKLCSRQILNVEAASCRFSSIERSCGTLKKKETETFLNGPEIEQNFEEIVFIRVLRQAVL
jgi:hypothetical protein